MSVLCTWYTLNGKHIYWVTVLNYVETKIIVSYQE